MSAVAGTASNNSKRRHGSVKAASLTADLLKEDFPDDTAASEDERCKYEAIIDRVIRSKYRPGMMKFLVNSKEIEDASQELGIRLKNPGDPIYTYRFRKDFPKWFRKTEVHKDSQGNKLEWMILLRGDGQYLFIMGRNRLIHPNPTLTPIRVKEARSLITIKANDEQSKLAEVRRHYILEHFLDLEETEVIQNHKRTNVKGVGQIEIDEIREGIDSDGAHYFIPIQAKNGHKERLASAQILADIEYHAANHPSLSCLPVAIKFLKSRVTGNETIACFLFKRAEDGFLDVIKEAHYTIARGSEESATNELVDLFSSFAKPKGQFMRK